MSDNTKNALLSINGGLLIILLSPFFKEISNFFYYSFLVIGVLMVINSGYLFFKNKNKVENKK